MPKHTTESVSPTFTAAVEFSDGTNSISMPSYNTVSVKIAPLYGTGNWTFKKKDGTSVTTNAGSTNDMGVFFQGDLMELVSTTNSTNNYTNPFVTSIQYDGWSAESYVRYRNYGSWGNANRWKRLEFLGGGDSDGIIIPHFGNNNVEITISIALAYTFYD